MTRGGRIHAAAAAFAVGYLFVGSVVTRSEGALTMSVPKVLLGAAVGWVVWMATGVESKKDRGKDAPEAPAVEKRPPEPCGDAVPVPARGAGTRPARHSPDRLKRLSELAFCDGRIVEAAYWLAIALLHGGTDRSERMRDYVVAWLEAGCPDELENVHVGFNAAQGSFGRSVLRFWSEGYRELAIARFTQMAQGGDDDARAFLDMYGGQVETGGAA